MKWQGAHLCKNVVGRASREGLLRRAPRAGGAHAAEPGAPAPGTFVHELFQGKLVSETRCLQCETVTNREEAFKDLSLEIEQNSSITACLRNFRRAQSSPK